MTENETDEVYAEKRQRIDNEAFDLCVQVRMEYARIRALKNALDELAMKVRNGSDEEALLALSNMRQLIEDDRPVIIKTMDAPGMY